MPVLRRTGSKQSVLPELLLPGNLLSCLLWLALLQMFAKKLSLSRWHVAQWERQETPGFTFGPCHWPGDHGYFAEPL